MSLQALKQLRNNYSSIKQALPWLDAAVWANDKADFPEYAPPVQTDYLKSIEASPELDSAQDIRLVRLNAAEYKIEQLDKLLDNMAKAEIPLAVLHTQVDFPEIEKLAAANPELNIIIESGDRKLIYHYEQVLHALQSYSNIYLCTCNFCNWLGHEQLVNIGLADRLLYGSHTPKYSADVAMSPIILGDFSWKIKCDIAGNNLRRLIGLKEITVPEKLLNLPEPFIIDAHAHNQQPGDEQVNGFPTPDMQFTPADWTDFMDKYACEKLFLAASEALFFNKSGEKMTKSLREFASERFYYFELFNPNLISDEYLLKLKKSLRHSACIGIKIHPSSHKVEADDDRYELIFQISEEFGKPIMTHSWDISEYNPVQYMSHPDRFRRHLTKYHKTPFILGHAGGRPGAFESTVQVCTGYPNVYVDFAGDYYHNGVIKAFADKIGSARILFASDVNWFDPRCNLGLFLGADLPDEDILTMLRTNAQKIYLRTL
jgi:predicted TIM-barrel fold metal-dependent hydrolase